MIEESLEVNWWQLELRFPSLLEESFTWKLLDLGLNRFAIESNLMNSEDRVLLLWLPAHEWSLEDCRHLSEDLIPLANTFEVDIPESKWKKVRDEDWNSSWKNHWQPDPIGNSFLILPSWLSPPEELSRRIVLKLDPGCAFGTGSHMSTRLCLEGLERQPPIGMQVVDLGCGSGILSMAALALGAKKVYAVDNDSLAVSSTKQNLSLNAFEQERFLVINGSVDSLISLPAQERFDLLLCNILASVIEKLAPEFENILKPNGKALLCGLLVDQELHLTGVLNSLGWIVDSSFQKKGWCMLEISRIYKTSNR